MLFCYLRKSRRYRRLFNVRSWSPELKSTLASPAVDYGWISWSWRTFWDVTDDDLLEHCGMDAISFLRALKFGRSLSYICCFNALWLIPLYATAEDSPETSYLQDPFVLISISNLPSQSPRFLGTVVAAYLTFFYAMYLLHREARWYTHYRHKFLAERRPRNYAAYVSGIPQQYRSSHDLAKYFRSCSSQDAVLEAHVAMNIPDLENKVLKRDALVRAVEHTIALEKRRGKTKTHRNFDALRRGKLERVETLASLEMELRQLDREIEFSTRQILSSNDPFRSKLVRAKAAKRLLDVPTDAEPALAATTAMPPTLLRERKKTIDFDHGDEMDDELKRILDPESEHAYEPDETETCHVEYDDQDDVEANFASFRRDPDATSSGRPLDDADEDGILEVLDPYPSTSTLGRYSAAATEAIGTCLLVCISRLLNWQQRFSHGFCAPSVMFTEEELDSQSESAGTCAQRGASPGPPLEAASVHVFLTDSPLHSMLGIEGSSLGADEPYNSPSNPDNALDTASAALRRPRSRDSSELQALPARDEGELSEPQLPTAKQGPDAAASLVHELNGLFGSAVPELPEPTYIDHPWSSSGQENGCETEDAIPGRRQLASNDRDWSKRVEQGSFCTGSESESSLHASADEPEPRGRTDQLDTGVRASFPTTRHASFQTSGKWSDRSGGSGRDLSPIREVTIDATRAQSKMSLMSEPRSDDPADDDNDLTDDYQMDLPRDDSFSHISVHSDMSGRSGRSSKGSGLRSTLSTGSKAVVTTSRRASSSLVSAGSTVMKGSVAASHSLAKGSRAASMSIMEGSKEVSKSIAKGSRVASSAIRKVAKDTSMDKVLESVGETGLKTIKTAHSIGAHVVTSAATVVPILANKVSGSARDAGFVVFTNLFTAQSALQMIHHPKVRNCLDRSCRIG